MTDKVLLEEVRELWDDPMQIVTYVTYVRQARLLFGRPKILTYALGSSKWHVKMGGLFIVPRVSVGARHLSSVWEFTRSYRIRSSGETVRKIPTAGFFTSKVAAALSEIPELVHVVHREVGPKLDQLALELRAAHSKFLQEARTVYEGYLASPERTRTNVEVLAKHVGREPGLRAVDPDLLARIASMDKAVLQGLVDLNRAVRGPVSKEAVLEAFGLSDAREVLDS